jgi:putative transcriptional regulator
MTLTKASHPDTSPDEPIVGGSILLSHENDPDARPLTHEDISRMRRIPQVKIIRRALGLSQELFSEQFRIPLGTLRDWEQGRKEPDAAARAYLKVIGRNPQAVVAAFQD